MTNDDKFDELLQEAARAHNSAPEVPRAEMWAAISAARGARTAGPATERAAQRHAPTVRVIPLHVRHRRALGWVTGLAAALLVGVVIGRQTIQPTSPAAGGGAIAQQSSRQAPGPQAPERVAASNGNDNGTGTAGPIIPAPGGPSSIAQGGQTVALAPNGRAVGRSSSAVSGPASIARDQRTGPTRNALSAREGAEEATLPYRLAAMQHLVTTEALLVSLRSDVRSGRKDTTIAVWAGDLLGTTRMLIDSPASRDPQLKQLLEDLELVLAQISRLPGAHGEAADLGLIDDAVRHREIMTRLRALSPNT